MTPRRSSVERRRIGLAAIVIVAAGCAAYANSFAGVFVFDDERVVADNPALYHFWPPTGWLTFSPTRAVVYATFAANHALHGTDPFGYHVVNLAIHLATALALFGLLRRTLLLPIAAARYRLRADLFAAGVALVWTVHPLGTQAVTYVYQRLESLAALFAVLSLYAFVRAYASAASASPRRAWAAAALAAAYAALFSKESVAALPLLTVVYDRLFLAGSWRGVLERKAYHAAAFGGLVLLAVLTLSSADQFQQAGLAVVDGLTPWTYAVSQAGVILHYLRLCVWPVGLCLDYGWPAARTWQDYVPQTAIVLSMAIASAWGLARGRLWSFPACAFFLLLAPTSSILPIVDLAYEHRMYLPLAAVICLAACGATELAERVLRSHAGASSRAPGRLFATLALGAMIVALIVLTLRRNEDYRSNEAMWRDVVAKAPENARGYANLAENLLKQRRDAEALPLLQRALELQPHAAVPNKTMAYWLIGQNRVSDAEPYLARLEQVPVARGDYLALRGMAATTTGQFDEAERLLRASLEVAPNDAFVIYQLGLAMERAGRDAKAAEAYQRSIAQNPNFASAHNNLGSIYFRRRNTAAAITEFQTALRLDPANANARTNLGLCFLREGRLDEAVEEFARCVADDGRHAGGRIYLGVALAQQGRLDEAVGHLETAVALHPDNRAARENLAWVRNLKTQTPLQAHAP